MSDLDKSTAFYRDRLGADIGRHTDHWLDLWLFGTQLTIYERPRAVVPAPYRDGQHWGATLLWSDWSARRASLEAADVEFATAPVENEELGVAKLMIRDPDGYLIELKAYRDPSRVLGRPLPGLF